MILEIVTSMLISITSTAGIMFLLGFTLGWLRFRNPISAAVKTAVSGDRVLALLIYNNGSAEFRALKRDGNYLIDEDGKRMWELKRLSVTYQGSGGMVVEKGSDKPVMIRLGRVRIPFYILHEENANAPSNPSLILIDPDLLIGKVSAKQLFLVKEEAELLGMLRERSKVRDAMYYFLLLLGIGIAVYLVLSAIPR